MASHIAETCDSAPSAICRERRQKDVSSLRSPLQYRAWLLDLDGTLYRQLPVRILMACELSCRGWSAIRVLRQFRRKHEQLRQEHADAGADPFERQIARTATELGIDRDEVAQVVESWMVVRPGKWLKLCARRSLLQAIARYRKLGGKTAVVSDYPARAKLATMGVSQLFDSVVASGESDGMTALKPNPESYLLACDRLEVLPECCLVIGDRWDADGEAARRAGIDFRHVSTLLHDHALYENLNNH